MKLRFGIYRDPSHARNTIYLDIETTENNLVVEFVGRIMADETEWSIG